MGTIVITGAGSGIGAATAARLAADGHRVIGVDLKGCEVAADLGTPAGRRAAIEEVGSLSNGTVDGLATFAGVAGLTDRSGALLVSVNYFGTVELLATGKMLKHILCQGRVTFHRSFLTLTAAEGRHSRVPSPVLWHMQSCSNSRGSVSRACFCDTRLVPCPHSALSSQARA